ncbi:LysR family transcriptional regulator [Parasedimentitalea maritima]|uniref:LysR family transcriptional regulator n=1 Tax=Parasedimentitalea maritima TaxID=2578117 RepID=A0ABY2UX13_9RHOB|nr:LysR family transcriptional regulator [Zongyanglinia marina]TLP66978.1 LysR family transcriptional regulator [Zongyanglinia marina]
MLELTPLKYFLSAFETGSFSHAAKANGVSQPTISAAIQKLEGVIGGSLFHRHRRGLTATPLGDRLYAEVAGSVAQLSGVVHRLQPETRRDLRIYCHPDVLLSPFAAGINLLKRAHPELFLGFTPHVDEADLAFVCDGCAPEGHMFQPLRRDPYGVALNRQHPLADGESVDLAELAAEARIHRPYCPHADRLPSEPDLPPLPPAQAVHDQQVLDLVAAGLGIAFVPMSHDGAHTDVVLRLLRNAPQVFRTLGISARKTVFARDCAQFLIEVTQ